MKRALLLFVTVDAMMLATYLLGWWAVALVAVVVGLMASPSLWPVRTVTLAAMLSGTIWIARNATTDAFSRLARQIDRLFGVPYPALMAVGVGLGVTLGVFGVLLGAGLRELRRPPMAPTS